MFFNRKLYPIDSVTVLGQLVGHLTQAHKKKLSPSFRAFVTAHENGHVLERNDGSIECSVRAVRLRE
jgi:hypothetical protein